MNHFYFVYDNDAYDINGLELLPSSAIKWSEYQDYDKLDHQRVVEYCILKEGD